VKLGLHLPDFTWPNGPSRLASDLGAVAKAADDAGFERLSVMDHVWQIGNVGPPSTRCSRSTRHWASWPLTPPG
jgi:alkanesulfonate monooxygenase SsuD/methylene tetrahydromethanopterin reductase-like flavin-dependent oxidoreductase (luciferase family)